MNDFEKQMTQYWMKEFPSVWSFFGSPEEARKIPTEHKDRIHFLNENGTGLINQFLESSKMTKDFPFKQCSNVDLENDTKILGRNIFR